MVEVRTPASDADSASAGEPQVIRNEARLDGDAFFNFDRDDLRPDAVAALDETGCQAHSASRVSRGQRGWPYRCGGTGRPTTRPCPNAAPPMPAYLVSFGGIPADQVDIRGEGEPQFALPE